MSEENVITNLRNKAIESQAQSSEQFRANLNKLNIENEQDNEEMADLMAKAGRRVEVDKMFELDQKIARAEDIARETIIAADIVENGLNKSNDMTSKRNSYRKLVSGLGGSHDRTKKILN